MSSTCSEREAPEKCPNPDGVLGGELDAKADFSNNLISCEYRGHVGRTAANPVVK